ncbi:hypothetical protein KIN20_025585 [Parelaphostrongylus tenuis]|uniref:Uncharacterized protein n=1 Tax=Parelaphostrongylus tenuis TaxID=148309 RepID=A0AAD5QWQ2_PARTN|nr:hypothetical protein KIN20_025585 [Parelaphostrongylus tenuis]
MLMASDLLHKSMIDDRDWKERALDDRSSSDGFVNGYAKCLQRYRLLVQKSIQMEVAINKNNDFYGLRDLPPFVAGLEENSLIVQNDP